MMRLLLPILFLFSQLFYVQFVYAQTTVVEQQICQQINKQKSAQLALLEKLVNINSGTDNIAGVRNVGAIVQRELNRLGFKTRWAAEPAEMHRAPTLIAERHGKQGKPILLIGHLDTVFSANSPFQRFTLRKKIAKGPGVIDDKGGLVVILSALKALQAVHALDNTSITIVLTGDEEDSGKPTTISRQPLRDAARGCAVALDFEPSISLNTGTIARRGIMNWTITAQGNESHSATIFQKDVGDGAIFELARILTTMRLQLKDQQYLAFNPGMIIGGTQVDFDAKTAHGSVFGKQNVVAKAALAKGDLRFIDAKQAELASAVISQIVAQHLPGTRATVQFEPAIPAMPPTDNNRQLLRQYSAVSEDLGYGAVKALPPGLRGAGDVSHVASIVPANLAGLGPVGYGTHSVIESIELNSLPIQTKKAALLIYRLTQEKT
jgi:glutamate carboxypeptidase